MDRRLASRASGLASALLIGVTAAACGDPTFLFRWGNGYSNPFYELYGIAMHPDGRLFTSEYAASRIQVFAPNGQFIAAWNTPPGVGIACDGFGFVYLVYQGGGRILKYTSDGTLVATFGSLGAGDGQFQNAYDVAIGPDGSVYVSDWGLKRVTKFGADGSYLLKWGSFGTGPGQFYGLDGIAVGPSGDVYVVDPATHRVQRFDANGNFIGQWGSEGPGPGQFLSPLGITTDVDGNVYVTDEDSAHCGVFKYTATGEFLWGIGSFGTAPGQMGDPRDVVVNEQGSLFIADRYGYVHVFGDAVTPTRRETWGSFKARYR